MALVVMTGALGCAPDPSACCVIDEECALGAVCFEGLCAPACDDVSQCTEGQLCVFGACAPPERALSHCPFDDKRSPVSPARDAGPAADAGPVVDAGPRRDGGPRIDAGGEPSCSSALEPNDEPAQAAALPAGEVTAGICPAGDDDWYLVTVTEGPVELVVVLTFVHADGDLDVEILDLDGSRVAVSQRAADVEEIRLPISDASAWRVHVYGFGQATNGYQLAIAQEPADAVCVDDALEDNDDATTATPLSFAAPTQAAFCAGDPDVYRATVPAFVQAWGELRYTRGDALELEVRDVSTGILGRAATGSGLELVPFGRASEADVRLRVGGAHDQPLARPYTLTLHIDDDSCGFDDAEPNDSVGVASPLSFPEGGSAVTVTGVACARDVDLWRLSWTEGAAALRLEVDASPGTRAFLVRRGDLALLRDLPVGPELDLPLDGTLVSGEVLLVVMGSGEDSPYALGGRALPGG